MSWAEAVTLTRELLADPSSRVCAAVSGWEYPISREGLILADHFDLHAQVNSKSRPKPYPRPMDAHRKRSIRPTVPQHVIRRALAARGHGRSVQPQPQPQLDPGHPEWDAMDHLLALEERRNGD